MIFSWRRSSGHQDLNVQLGLEHAQRQQQLQQRIQPDCDQSKTHVNLSSIPTCYNHNYDKAKKLKSRRERAKFSGNFSKSKNNNNAANGSNSKLNDDNNNKANKRKNGMIIQEAKTK